MQKVAVLLAAISRPAIAHQVTGITTDTIKLLVDRREVKIRLAKIDAPERKQAFGANSGQSLSELCWGVKATYETQGEDRYAQTVAVVTCGGLNVNRAQVEHGIAWVYPKYNNGPVQTQLQKQAKAEGRGLWADEEPVAPWEWRRLNDLRKNNSLRGVNRRESQVNP